MIKIDFPWDFIKLFDRAKLIIGIYGYQQHKLKGTLDLFSILLGLVY